MEQNENTKTNSEGLQLLNVNVVNEDSISQVSSSLLSLSSSKKLKNSSLSLNKKSGQHTNLLSSIKNSTLNVLSKPLSLSRSPSPQLALKRNKNQQPIDLEANIIVNKESNLIETSEEDEENFDEYDENEHLSDISDLDAIKIKRQIYLRKNKCELTPKAVEELDSDTDSSESNENENKETSKLNICSTSKPSLKTLSYSSVNSQSNKPTNIRDSKKKLKVNQPISIKINEISSDEENQDRSPPLNNTINLPLDMNKIKCESNETLVNKSTNLPLKTILSNSSAKSTTNLDHKSNNLIENPLQQSTRNSVSFSSDTLKIDENKKEYTQQESCVSAPIISNNYNNYNNLANDRLSLNPDMGLSSSITSSTLNMGLNSSYSPLLVNRQLSATSQVPIKVLHKTMTKGSKAMRIMGSNNTNGLMPNGFLKNSGSSDGEGFKGNLSRSSNSKKQQKRLFFKNGNINISRCNIDKRRRRYLTDIFTTLIDLKWRYNILVFALGFFISWTLFAITWYLISYFHGDLDSTDQNRTACISGIHGFAGAILFSIETQQTIGYGVRFTTEKCPEAIFVMMIQSSVGVMIQSFMVGVVFAKLSRPKKRSETLMFSKNAVISLRDGRLCLICRVGDMRKSHIVEAHVRMYLIKKKVTQEGEIMPLHMYDLNVGWDKGLDRLFLVWPLTIEHNIDENSPFWTISAEDLKKERFELAVILEGIVESTGMTTQARTSYLVNEILWGHRFEKLITFQKEDGTYKIDYSRFDMTVPIDTPTCSAKELAELKEQENYFSYTNLNESTTSTFTACDLRKRRVEKEDENDEQKIINASNNIKMVIEDHSEPLRSQFDLNDNFNSYNSALNSTQNNNSAILSNSTNQLISNENELSIFNKLKI